MQTLIYKRTHKGDPDKQGRFGIHDCMGRVRSRDFDAVIGMRHHPEVCPVHGAGVTWWNRANGGAVCGRCHPDPFALAVREAAQSGPPSMPAGVRLLAWKPKHPSVALSVFSVVNDTQKFILSTLQQLEAALRVNPWAAGNWTVRDLCERLEQVGVRIEVVEKA